MKIKAHLIFDNTKRSLQIKKSISKLIEVTLIKNCNLMIVVGGDGFMLSTLKKFSKTKIRFYGINSGNYGFLMNKFSKKNFLKNLKNIKIHPLEMTAKTRNNKIKKTIAINEISILRQSKQAAMISIEVGKTMVNKKLISDGVLVSTPAGSTAYNLSVHGPILDLNSKKLAVTPISPFRPRRWKGLVISEKKTVTIKNLDIKKRPVSAVADNFEVRNIKLIKIKIDKNKEFNLLYNKDNSLEKKIKIEQTRKEFSFK